ncbi:hypothetical protein C8R44DRAFT_754597 [Mycena epipterygia]|nr:hypothetical protein C8R44DRAFT_754597 [Mycena epipterygia]
MNKLIKVLAEHEEIGQNKLKLGLGAHWGLYDPPFKGSTRTWWHWLDVDRKWLKLGLGLHVNMVALGGGWSEGDEIEFGSQLAYQGGNCWDRLTSVGWMGWDGKYFRMFLGDVGSPPNFLIRTKA